MERIIDLNESHTLGTNILLMLFLIQRAPCASKPCKGVAEPEQFYFMNLARLECWIFS
jgi:hypothetical protein